MDADLDTLAAARYVRTDDLLKCCPERAPWRPPIGITPGLSDAELLSLAVMQALLGTIAWWSFPVAWHHHLRVGPGYYLGAIGFRTPLRVWTRRRVIVLRGKLSTMKPKKIRSSVGIVRLNSIDSI